MSVLILSKSQSSQVKSQSSVRSCFPPPMSSPHPQTLLLSLALCYAGNLFVPQTHQANLTLEPLQCTLLCWEFPGPIFSWLVPPLHSLGFQMLSLEKLSPSILQTHYFNYIIQFFCIELFTTRYVFTYCLFVCFFSFCWSR